jgi:polysaccharide chain length determinant protein (PEP-CTERM system associated)
MKTNDTPSTLGDYIGILRRRRIFLLVVIPAALLLAVYLAYALPPHYRSSATIMLETASVSPDLVRTTVSSYADQQFELVQRRVLTSENLEPLVKEFDPYPDMPELTANAKAKKIIEDTLIERVDPVTFEVLQESNAFSIYYHNADPARAKDVAQRISNLFLDFNRLARNERATSAYDFLLSQAQEVERRISEVDLKVAQFKARHGDALPESQVRNLGAAERASQNIFSIEAQIRAAEERRGLLEVQLSKLSPTLGSTTGNTQAELAVLQGQLADARVRYTPDHPDVKRLQRQIEALAAKQASEPTASRVVPNNPDYIGVQSQLDATRREISALQGSAERERAQVYAYEAGAAAAPTVEKEYLELARNREVLQKQFDDVQAKLRQADVARNLETEQRGDRFTQIRAPNTPDTPYSPNRLGIILLGIVLGGGIAMGLAALAESSDPSVRSVRDLREITSIPAIASLPVMFTETERRRRSIQRISYACVLIAATAFVAATVFTA